MPDSDAPVPFALTPMALVLLDATPVFTCPRCGAMSTAGYCSWCR